MIEMLNVYLMLHLNVSTNICYMLIFGSEFLGYFIVNLIKHWKYSKGPKFRKLLH